MIRAPKVRLVDDDGSQIGVKDTNEAREYAWGKNLDLVEVAAQADPPVAKVMDYGKYRYEQEQKAKLARKHQVSVNIKDRKSTRLNSSHVEISYAVFCLKKKT